MSPDIDIFFKDTSSISNQIMKAELFQQTRYKQFIKYQQQKIIALEQILQDKCSQIKSMQERKTSLDMVINKLNESHLYLQQKLKQPRTGSRASTVLQKFNNNKQSSFISNVMNAINEQIEENDTIQSNGNSTIYHGRACQAEKLSFRF